MSAALSLLIAFLSMSSVKTELSACPVGAVIDRIEGDRMVVVMGADGVRSIAASSVEPQRGRSPREGMRVRRARDGRCVADSVDSVLDSRVRARLRALGARR
ncbi:MAG: hypothetical protein U0269_29235 [Polyangiales bacterium]